MIVGYYEGSGEPALAVSSTDFSFEEKYLAIRTQKHVAVGMTAYTSLEREMQKRERQSQRIVRCRLGRASAGHPSSKVS